MSALKTPVLPLRRLIIALELFTALTAFAGGLALFFWRDGSGVFPLSLLQWSPFTTFTPPALLLGAVVGGTSLIGCVLVWRRSSLAIDALLLAGGALTVWIIAECAIIRGVSWLHFLYGAIGLVVLAVGIRAAWRSGVPRHRWLVMVTVFEAVGFLAPALTGILSARAGIDGWPQTALLVAAGALEGLLLGTGQALAFPFAVRKARYAAATSLAAAFVWACVMSTMMLGVSEVPVAVFVVSMVIAGLLSLVAIGFAQWRVLREHVRPSASWIAWTALAWVVALPLSFTPAPFVDASTPIAVHLILWSTGGLLMAWVMALITWQGVRQVSSAKSLRARFLDDLARGEVPQPGASSVLPVTEAGVVAIELMGATLSVTTR